MKQNLLGNMIGYALLWGGPLFYFAFTLANGSYQIIHHGGKTTAAVVGRQHGRHYILYIQYKVEGKDYESQIFYGVVNKEVKDGVEIPIYYDSKEPRYFAYDSLFEYFPAILVSVFALLPLLLMLLNGLWAKLHQ